MRHPRALCARVLSVAGPALLAGAIAAGAPGAFQTPLGSEHLESGATLIASWTVDPSEVQGLDETELVLSFDGGASYPVRLTGRIPPEARSTRWRVPALPTEHARIALRAGVDERSGTEKLLFMSESFTITSPGRLPREDFFPVNDEWRTREALEGAPVRPASRSFSPPSPEPALDPLDADDADDAGTDDALAADDTASRHDFDASPQPLFPSSETLPSSAPRIAAGPLRL